MYSKYCRSGPVYFWRGGKKNSDPPPDPPPLRFDPYIYGFNYFDTCPPKVMLPTPSCVHCIPCRRQLYTINTHTHANTHKRTHIHTRLLQGGSHTTSSCWECLLFSKMGTCRARLVRCMHTCTPLMNCSAYK